jgi:deoxyribodipyrimidine photolyase-related protein
MEIRQETDYVNHHIQKIIGFFLAMRAFAAQLKNAGYKVIYLNISDKDNNQDLEQNIHSIIEKYGIEHFECQFPDEYRLDIMLKKITQNLTISSGFYNTEHFLSDRLELRDFFSSKKQFLMENWYRFMRRKYDILMENGKPAGGEWNYDKENREKLPNDLKIPEPLYFTRNITTLKKDIDKAGIKYIGRIDPENFIWPVTRSEILKLFDHFTDQCLPYFGRYQDSMTTESWSIYHSRISFGFNTKLIGPLEIIRKTENHWKKHKDSVSIAQVEGFIRQILGWREYMRGIYWAFMPDYSEKNFFSHDRKLPKWYWTGNTRMNCLSHAINQSLDYAYAHHIQRLMVTGNFGLLAGIHPDEMDSWYLGIYIDAVEWVEITNTRGMSQFADGGIVGTKPYVSSANYIHKMGNYCNNCHYSKSIKTGAKACPFNSLYWHFYDRNRKKLEKNPRVSIMYRTWDKMDVQDRKKIIEQAEIYLKKINGL